MEVLMPTALKRILFWTPRILSILFILFIGLFSLDVFGTGASFWDTLLGFLIHNIPAFILLTALILAWRWEWVGAVLFAGFGIWYLVTSWGKFPWSVPLLVAGLPILMGVLFLVGWVARKQIRSTST
jgi:hypothetical protein